MQWLAGNAAFHGDCLYPDLEAAIPHLVHLVQTETDDRTQANAAGALGNLVRHSDQLCQAILDSGAIPALIVLIEEYLNNDADGMAAWTALFTLGNFCSYPDLKSAIVQSGIQTALQKAATSSRLRIIQFTQRLCSKLNM